MARDINLNERRIQKKTVFSIIIFLLEALLVVLLAYAITQYGFVKVEISDENMKPTLGIGDEVIVDKLSYKVMSIKRSDVIIVSEKSSDHTYYTSLRVIGMPGEKVWIRDGYVYINGKKIKEELKFEKMNSGGDFAEEVELGKNEYFLLGDNRNNCLDSRDGTVGLVKEEDIIGKAFIRRKPFAFVNSIDKF